MQAQGTTWVLAFVVLSLVALAFGSARAATLAEEFAPPRVVGVTSRVACRGEDVVACTVGGRKSKLEFELTVLNGVNGHASIEDFPVALLGPVQDAGAYRPSIDEPLTCFSNTTCVVPRQRSLSVSVRVSREIAVFKTAPFLNHIPFATIWTNTDVGAEGIGFANFSTNPAYSVPSLLDTRKSALSYGNANLIGCQATMPPATVLLDLPDLEAAGISTAAWTDTIPTVRPIRGTQHHRVCTGAFCPANGITSFSDHVAQVHEVGPMCMLRHVSQHSEPHFELEVEVRDDETGSVDTVYAILTRGRSEPIYSTKFKTNIQVYAKILPLTRRSNNGAPSMRGVGALMFCDYMELDGVTTKIVRPPVELESGLLHNVATKRHGGVLWYAVPEEDLPLYGRSCGQQGMLAETLFRESSVLLGELCYDPLKGPSCVSNGTSPAKISDTHNRYAVNASASAVRPRTLLPEPLWEDQFRRTYLANVDNRGVIRGSKPLSYDILHEGNHLPVDMIQSNHSAHQVRVRVDIGDALLSSPHTDRFFRSVYAQRIDPVGTTCTLTDAIGALRFRYCTPTSMGVVTANGGRKPYIAEIECDASVGLFHAARSNQTIFDGRTRTQVRFSAPVGGPAGQCTDFGLPLIIAPNATTVAAEVAQMGDVLNIRNRVGSCRITLMDGTFTNITVGSPNNIDCYFTKSRDGDEEGKLTIEPPKCTLFSDDPRCTGYVWVFLGIIIIGTATIVVTAFAIVVIALGRASRKKRAVTQAANEKEKKNQ